ncbi:hypothetical protein [Crenobacter cavernae]|uniref:RNA polymerase sigma-70 region 4 domain-containing protein n=1 Tax=Crenobacter cavernae TaxID=2290923 RepID=A0ABY0FAK0_9NEIS|nr:hypothetical protein [Crenobacter cavernae]RXZ42691.1 hypothetical protein EBB06_12415 [Crenobacter cavernae]
MQFNTIKAIVGWAFQMSEAVPVKSAKYDEFTGPAFGGMAPGELKDAASDILVKVSRLPADEQAVVTAYFTGATKAVHQAADTLPSMPTGLRRELVRGWAVQLERDQKEMAATYGLSEATMTRRKKQVFGLLNVALDRALATLEVQLLPLLHHKSVRNANRSFHSCIPA